MSLKEIISRWNTAAEAYHQGQHRQALTGFKELNSVHPSAKILFNIASIHYWLGELDTAYQFLTDCITADGHLAVGYFLRGIVLYKLERYDSSYEDFQKTCRVMSHCSVIDYNQLGLPVKLFTCEVLCNAAAAAMLKSDRFNAQLCLKQVEQIHESLEIRHICIYSKLNCLLKMNSKNIQIRELPDKCIFQPPKTLVANLPKRDYLGKAKVVSSVFDNGSNSSDEMNKKLGVPTCLQQIENGKQQTKVRTPPPSRPPPRPILKARFSKPDHCLSGILHTARSGESGNQPINKSVAGCSFSKSEHNILGMLNARSRYMNKHGIVAPPRPPPTWKTKVNVTEHTDNKSDQNFTKCLNCSDRRHMHVYECIENCDTRSELYECLHQPSRMHNDNAYKSLMINTNTKFESEDSGSVPTSSHMDATDLNIYENTAQISVPISQPVEYENILIDADMKITPTTALHSLSENDSNLTSASSQQESETDVRGSVSNLISRFEIQTLTT